MIPYGRQNISEADIAAVTEVLRSDFLTQGPAVPAFEAAVAERVGAAHAVAVNSATSALHIAAAALGLGPGDCLWTVPNTFVASANCALYCGARVDFVDIDPQTYVMSVPALSEKLDHAAREGTLPKVLVSVHLAGQSCEMAEIGALARRYGVRVIEDASHAIGASYRERPVGDCAHSDITIFSFHPVKIVTTGEGGVATTQDAELARRMTLLRSHGITRDRAQMTTDLGAWYYEQIALGWNYRLTDIAAALGTSQLARLDSVIARRREIAAAYDADFAGTGIVIPMQHTDTASSWHLYVVLLPAEHRQRIFDGLRAAGIGVNIHYYPVHLQPHYRGLGFRPGQFPAAEDYAARAISLPIHTRLTEAERTFVVAQLLTFLSEGAP